MADFDPSSYPGFSDLSPEDQAAIRQNLGITPIPRGTPLAKLNLVPKFPVHPVTPKPDLSGGANITRGNKMIEDFLSREKGQFQQDITDLTTPLLGTTGGATMGGAASAAIPTSTPEITGDVAMAMLPGAPLGYRLVVPPLAAALESYLTGSKVTPMQAGVQTGVGNTLGVATEGAAHFAAGHAGSLPGQIQGMEDLRITNQALNRGLPDVVPPDLKTPAQTLEYFRKPANSRWGQFKQTARTHENTANTIRDNLNAQAAQEDAFAERIMKSKMSNRQWAADQARKRAAAIRAQIGPSTRYNRQQAAFYENEYNRRADPYEALQKHIYKKEHFDVIGTNKYNWNGGKVQDVLIDPVANRELIQAGVPQSAVDAVTRQMYGQPSAPMGNVISEKDTEAVPILGGYRGHLTGMTRPMFGAHFNIPKLAMLAGNRMRAVRANPLWGLVTGGLSNRAAYAIGGQEEDEGTIMPPPGPSGDTH